MKTNFNPLSHGYYFPNRFEFKGLSRIVKMIKSNFIYGMCGGMVFTAMDYYFDQEKLPGFKAVDELPLSYTKYLWKRQTQSVSISVLLKIIQFATLPVSKSMQKSTLEELPKIIERLNDGLPAPIVIIRSSFFQNPTHNHQVLITGYEDNGSTLDLEIYDPNHPNLYPRLTIHRKPEYLITQSTGEPIRGLFLNKYLYQFSFIKQNSN
jgi:hypothetical protein